MTQSQPEKKPFLTNSDDPALEKLLKKPELSNNSYSSFLGAKHEGKKAPHLIQMGGEIKEE